MSGRLHRAEPLAVVVNRIPTIDPKRLNRVAEILLDIIDTANRLDSKTTPGKDGRP